MEYSNYDPSQAPAIGELFTRVFAESESQKEGDLVGTLALDLMATTHQADLYGFVAAEQNQIRGCIFFSRLTFDDPVSAFLLAPVVVDTQVHGRGIGQTLIKFGLEKLRQDHVQFVFTYGDPAFYSKTGFHQITETIAKAPLPLTLPHGWQCQTLNDRKITALPGTPQCVGAFDKPELW